LGYYIYNEIVQIRCECSEMTSIYFIRIQTNSTIYQILTFKNLDRNTG